MSSIPKGERTSLKLEYWQNNKELVKSETKIHTILRRSGLIKTLGPLKIMYLRLKSRVRW